MAGEGRGRGKIRLQRERFGWHNWTGATRLDQFRMGCPEPRNEVVDADAAKINSTRENQGWIKDEKALKAARRWRAGFGEDYCYCAGGEKKYQQLVEVLKEEHQYGS